MQFLGLASIAAILVVAGVGAASTLRGDPAEVTTSEGSVTVPDAGVAAKRAAPPVAQNITSTPAPTPAVQQQAAAPAVVVPDAPIAEPTRAAAPSAGFVLVEGRTQLTDSIVATRAGDSVVVNFDAYGYRTRRASKIEVSMRTTLPMIFGRSATAFIDTLPAGALVTNHDVVGELARDGMRVTLDNGATARIRVLTRVVSDGPIAIGYLAIIER